MSAAPAIRQFVTMASSDLTVEGAGCGSVSAVEGEGKWRLLVGETVDDEWLIR